jgi:hypothetical protein
MLSIQTDSQAKLLNQDLQEIKENGDKQPVTSFFLHNQFRASRLQFNFKGALAESPKNPDS